MLDITDKIQKISLKKIYIYYLETCNLNDFVGQPFWYHSCWSMIPLLGDVLKWFHPILDPSRTHPHSGPTVGWCVTSPLNAYIFFCNICNFFGNFLICYSSWSHQFCIYVIFTFYIFKNLENKSKNVHNFKNLFFLAFCQLLLCFPT